MKTILLGTRNSDAAGILTESLLPEFGLEHKKTVRDCLKCLEQRPYEFVFIDLELLEHADVSQNDESKLQPFWDLRPEADIVILCEPSRLREAVKLVKNGAADYLTYPVDPVEIRHILDEINKEVRQFAELKYLRKEMWNQDHFIVLSSKSPVMRRVLERIRTVALTESTVLLTGETGVGKGVITEMIHRHSKRADKQLISVHCGAIPDTLLESELFGHEKGAFTGAVRKKLGKFEIASGGTLFLDEIGTITPAMQIKLLQVLQDRCFQRVGGEAPIRADVRIIAASNVNLLEMVKENRFREDLFYRLNVFPVEIPPLRERKEDIPDLVRSFLNKLNRYSVKSITSVDDDVMHALIDYDWPGNIRELENLIERAYVLEKQHSLSAANFPSELFDSSFVNTPINPNHSLEDVRRRATEDVEKQYLVEQLSTHAGRIDQTAAAAGIGVRQLHKLMRKYHLDKRIYK